MKFSADLSHILHKTKKVELISFSFFFYFCQGHHILRVACLILYIIVENVSFERVKFAFGGFVWIVCCSTIGGIGDNFGL